MDSKKAPTQSNSEPAKTPDNVAGSSAPVSTASESTTTTAAVSSADTVAAASTPETTTTSSATPVTPTKKKGKGCIIALVIALIALLMLCGCGFIASRMMGEVVNDVTIQEKIEDKVKDEVEKGVRDGLGLPQKDNEGSELTSLQTYSDENIGFSFSYPETWEAKGTMIGTADSGYTMINVADPSGDYKVVIMAAKSGSGTQMQKVAPKGLQEVEASSNASVTFGNISGLTLTPVYYADGNKIKEIAFTHEGAQTFEYNGVTYLVYITSSKSDNSGLDLSDGDAMEQAERIFSSVGELGSEGMDFDEEAMDESLKELERIFKEFENYNPDQQ